jgi:hypothetical protein
VRVRVTDLYESMLVLERLEYPSSILGKGDPFDSAPERDLMVDVELVRRAGSEHPLAILVPLARLPYILEPGVMAGPLHSLPMREFPHCHAMSGPLFLFSMSAMCLGGGRGGGTGSLIFGMGIGTEGEGDESVLGSIDRLEVRNRSDGFESGTWI